MKNFRKLYLKFQSSNDTKVVRLVDKVFIDVKAKPSCPSDENVIIKQWGGQVVDILDKNNLKDSSAIPNELIELLRYVESLDVDDFKCSPPLQPGDITFNKIAGLYGLKESLEKTYINPFKYPRLFKNKPKGILLYGIPGGGKTLIAKAATNQLPNVAFFAPTSGEIRGKYEGETEKNITSIFKCAERATCNKEYKNSIIFFDEFDSIAGRRGEDASMTRSVNTLLQSMDGITSSENVSVLAATNFPDSIDEAILRRFTSRVFVDVPDLESIEYIIRYELAKQYSNPDLENVLDDIYIRKGNSVIFNDGAQFILNITRLGNWPHSINLPQFIRNLAKRLTVNDVGRAVIEDVKTKPGYNIDTDERLYQSVKLFGYSPSDVTKLVNHAIDNASKVVVTEPLINFQINNEGGNSYYVATRNNTNIKLANIPPSNRDSIISFMITPKDFDDAFSTFRSTINNRDYVRLLLYSLSN
jgi:SpoVK/Ycf46/Vps4 family AAA+-type ATPase